MNQNQFNTAMQGWMDTQRNKEIVFIDNGETVTDSLTVAEVFGKRHADVIRSIETLECSEEFTQRNFALSDYKDSTGRTLRKYIMTQDGFSFLVMGYTGKEAARFKEMYIGEFNRMRQQLQSGVPSLSPNQAMAIALQQTAEMMTKVPVLESRIDQVEQKVDEQITLASGEQRRLQKAINSKVYSLTQDKEERSEYFRQLHREIKNRCQVTSYKDVLRTDLQKVLKYVDGWVPMPTN
ncbi:Rha family transcriptional regulator [Paenibacillus alvei]|uniref:Phage regulatory protein, rha family n=1 Tax=Paenibacillus alvei TaxID=44250 RepID=A0A383RH84_PAEAL|nr:Rha family transcriptional regulator [Paenibacillus alvei]SYX85942.1 Phage regulatory protein, rha family [Paenibacillus alvei]SYX87694.1 Phage regulatory protein, rha family [Paenibacillus alvei]